MVEFELGWRDVWRRKFIFGGGNDLIKVRGERIGGVFGDGLCF